MRRSPGLRAPLAVVVFLGVLGSPAAAARAQVFEVIHARGFLEGSFYPPHNEFDPSPGVPFPLRPTARYGLRSDFELNLVKVPNFLVFADLRFYFGDTRPQTHYSYSTKGLAANLVGGFGYRLASSPDLQIRYATGKWVDLGGLVWGDRLPWSALQVRWTFDSR
jgi:hypothetical protein